MGSNIRTLVLGGVSAVFVGLGSVPSAQAGLIGKSIGHSDIPEITRTGSKQDPSDLDHMAQIYGDFVLEPPYFGDLVIPPDDFEYREESAGFPPSIPTDLNLTLEAASTSAGLFNLDGQATSVVGIETVGVVPAPGSGALIVVGLAAIAGRRRRSL